MANAYNIVLWTVNLEFRSSLILFATHAALFFIQPFARTAIVVGMIAWGVVIHAYDVPLFLVGYLIAEYHQDAVHKRNLPRTLFWWIVLLLGTYFASYPAWAPEAAPLYTWLMPWTPFEYRPDYRFWHSVGASLLLLATSKIPLLIRLYCTTPIQYLGKVSFALYLTHLWIEQGIGEILFFHVWSITGNENLAAEMLGFCIGYCVIAAICFWAADIFWRAVDQPSVNIAFKLQTRLFRES